MGKGYKTSKHSQKYAYEKKYTIKINILKSSSIKKKKIDLVRY
jgi:hypothetical protein